MITVSGADFTKSFGKYRTLAHKQPVSVTSYGKEDLVVVDAEEFKRLKARDREALFACDLKASDIDALSKDDIPEAAKQFDNEME